MSDQSDGSVGSLGVNEGDEDVALAGDVNATTRSMAAGTERADVEDEYLENYGGAGGAASPNRFTPPGAAPGAHGGPCVGDDRSTELLRRPTATAPASMKPNARPGGR